MNILYIHGYNGNMYGNSYHHLKRHIELDNQRMYDLLTSRGHVILADTHSTKLHSIDYDPEQPEQAIQSIKQYVADNQIDLIIGASLGGFLAMHIFGIPRIVVNPCWDPAVELPIVGYTGDTTVYQQLLNELLENINEKESRLCAGCFAANDELLGTRYKSEFEKHFQHTFDISDGHKITDTSAKEIIDYASMRMLRPLR